MMQLTSGYQQYGKWSVAATVPSRSSIPPLLAVHHDPPPTP
ncbi:hypothetical protein E2C01_082632 [Portunus trituberculatus]|uniref:Uncharacterized protein n=1 Tax=Portunus trituberculatus TaxID=210409 RepID=A0A5B7IZM8_PORTR|nr:hypothetical protein [Portunus trituberculatus]